MDRGQLFTLTAMLYGSAILSILLIDAKSIWCFHREQCGLQMFTQSTVLYCAAGFFMPVRQATRLT